MTINHHPSDETLLGYAAGALPAGTRLVISVHVQGCSRCARDVGRFEAIGGQVLTEAPGTELSQDLLGRTLASLDRDDRSSGARGKAVFEAARRSDGIILPRALSAYETTPWRWISPGIHLSRVKVQEDPDANVILLRVGANRLLPEHGHTGTEFTQVLTGSLIDGSKRLMPGDIMEASADLEHQPVAGHEGECICLAVVEGKLRIGGLIGRTVLSLVGL